MVATDPSGLARVLTEKAPPEDTHTVVLWTKNPTNMLHNADLFSKLKEYDQLYLHLSITGLGTFLEPHVPAANDILANLADYIDFIGGPERIYIRFDPIVHFRLQDGATICNLQFF